MRRRREWRSSRDRLCVVSTERLTSRARGAPAHRDAVALGRVKKTALNELVVRQARGARRLRQAGVVRWIRKNARERIYFDDIGHAIGVEAHVDTRPIAAAEHSIGAEDDALDGDAHRVAHRRRTGEDVERLVWAVPDPFRFVAVDRNGAA